MQTSTCDPQTLLEKWQKGALTAGLAIGHLIQRVLDHEERLRAMAREQNHSQQES